MKEWLEILLRSVALFFTILFLVRLLGKRNMARTTPFNFINYVVIAVIASLISVKIIENLAFGFLALGVWIVIPVILDYIAMRSKLLHDLINGRETVLIKQGKVMEENLMHTRMTGQELLRELRSKNIFNLADVEFAIMETTGEINVLPKPDKKPVTPHDMGQKVSPQSQPQTVILDGNILDEPLSDMGFNREWLTRQLEGMGVTTENVFIAQADSSGNLYVDLFDDALQLPQPRVKELIYANLEKCQADLVNYALETQNKRAKKMYEDNANKIKQVMETLEPYLLR